MNTAESNDIEKIRHIIEELKVAMLVTADGELNMHARPMHTADIDSQNNIWFMTKDGSGKVAEMVNDHHVSLTYSCPKSGKYLSVTGIASFNNNSNKKKELFNIFGKAWFPDGANDPNLLLIKINPDKAEYWETSSNRLVQLFKVVKAIATNQVYDGGEHGKVNQI